MSKIVFIGGGSAKFIRELVVDLFCYLEFHDSHITLMDIDRERVERSERIVRKIISDRKLGATVESTGDRRYALEGADYVIITIMVGGLEHYYSDSAIPAKYGVFQTVGDTTGVGGVFRLVRTAPVLQGIAQDLKQVAPEAWVLNYANPMSMNTWVMNACGHTRTIGLCHSVQGCCEVTFAKWLGLRPEGIRYTAGGINHINFYLTLSHEGRDIYPDLRAAADRIIKEDPVERVRFELLEYLGYFPAEGPQHQSEYYPWFRKDQRRIEHYAAETFWGYNIDSKHMQDRIKEVEAQIAGKLPIDSGHSLEYGARIIHSLASGELRTFYGNVPNRGLIENLPSQAIVEVPCLVGATGISPCRVGRIPPQLAAVMTPHIGLHEMTVEAVLSKDRRLIGRAIQADPLSGAILTLPEIEQMVNELLEENREYLDGWR